MTMPDKTMRIDLIIRGARSPKADGRGSRSKGGSGGPRTPKPSGIGGGNRPKSSPMLGASSVSPR